MAEKKKKNTFLEWLAYAFEHRELVTYEDKVKRDNEAAKKRYAEWLLREENQR